MANLIKADINRSDVSGANGRHGEEAMLPSAHVDGSLVEVEHTLKPTRYTWINAEQLT